MFGQYKRITNHFTGVLTGKGMEYGGSELRPEATGYGTVYFLESMLQTRDEQIEGKKVCISGSGNVAIFAAEKIIHRGGVILTLSDSDGYVYDKDGIDLEKIAWVKHLKTVRRGRISEYADQFGAEFHAGERPWSVPCSVALPCATQNEISLEDAKTLLANGCMAVSEGANMPTVIGGIEAFLEAKILFGPSKAANAGGVGMSGMEMSQNAGRRAWGQDELQTLLRKIMDGVHKSCHESGLEAGGYCNYVRGANVAGFRKVADAMLAFGVV